MDWDSSLSVLVTDSLQREELGAGKVSTCAVEAEKDGALVPELGFRTTSIDETIASDSGTETVMGMVVELRMPPSCKVQESACIALPEES